MPSANSLYNLIAPKPQPPPYNKVAKLNMTVEVETVQMQPDKALPLPRHVSVNEGSDAKRGQRRDPGRK